MDWGFQASNPNKELSDMSSDLQDEGPRQVVVPSSSESPESQNPEVLLSTESSMEVFQIQKSSKKGFNSHSSGHFSLEDVHDDDAFVDI